MTKNSFLTIRLALSPLFKSQDFSNKHQIRRSRLVDGGRPWQGLDKRFQPLSGCDLVFEHLKDLAILMAEKEHLVADAVDGVHHASADDQVTISWEVLQYLNYST